MKRIVVFLLMMMLGASSFSQVKRSPVPVKKKTTVPVKKTTVKNPVVTKPVVKAKADTSVKVKITTEFGVIVIKLYDSTPLHRDNFVKLVKQGFYDSLLFHRVIPNFMIQGGDPMSKYAPSGTMLGGGGGEMERIPAEFVGTYIHKKGVLAAARDGNPEKKSSACQFYIVEGTIITDEMLNQMEQQNGRKYTPEQRMAYKTQGGTPHLDNNYTVFGETISGLEVISKISAVAQDRSNRPLLDLRMSVQIVR